MINSHPQGKIAILRLDMDIYDPTIFVLRMLYDRISQGGVRVAVKEFCKEKGIVPHLKTIENSTPVYWLKE